VHGVTHITVAVLFCSSSLLCISNSDWATENEAERSVSVNGNKEPAGEICHPYSSIVTAIIPYSSTIKLQYTLPGDYWVCVRPTRLPVLTWVPSSIPPENNIQDTFLIGSATDTTIVVKWLSALQNDVVVPLKFKQNIHQNIKQIFLGDRNLAEQFEILISV